MLASSNFITSYIENNSAIQCQIPAKLVKRLYKANKKNTSRCSNTPSITIPSTVRCRDTIEQDLTTNTKYNQTYTKDKTEAHCS